jgi:tetratricopeptide (TPR) repeat protein
MSTRLAAFRAALLATAASIPLAAVAQTPNPAVAQAGTGDVIRVLLDQSAYWRSKNEDKLADEALSRVLALDPNNIDALAMQAQAAADRGDKQTANQALAKLKAVRPDDPRIASIQQALQIGPIDQSALAEARRLAQDGKPAQAVDAYRRVFKGTTPPPSLATEYYQTLGATEGNWGAAKDGLAAHLRADPNDLPAQLAYAELLTYRDETRGEGLKRLAFLTREPQVAAAADRAWRQALSWLPATQSSVALYDDYLSHNPTDTEVQHWRAVASADSGTLRNTGFDDLQNNRIQQADADFSKALQVDPNDSDSMIGLALVRFKENRQADGRDLIRKAIEIDPSKSTQYQSMLDTSAAQNGTYNNGTRYVRSGNNGGYDAAAARKIRGEYAEVNTLSERGDFNRAEALLRRLMGRRPNAGNYLQLGYIQERAGRLADAEASFRTVLRSQPRNVAALSGLAGVLQRENKGDEADRVYAQAESYGGGGAIGASRADQLRKQAESVADPAARVGLFRAAVAADPANPWLRLELARSLQGQGRDAEAREVMAPVIDASRPTADQLRAGIYFAQGSRDYAAAATLVARLPAKARTPEMQEIGQNAEISRDVQDAKSQPSTAAMQQRMLQLAAKPDPTGSRGAQFAQELVRAGDRAGARDVIRVALSASRAPTPQQRIAYAGALIGAGYPREAKVVTAGLQPAELNPLQRSNLREVQDNAAVSAADNLNARGQTQEALTELTPRLQQDPANPALNMALARVYEKQNRTGTAVAITQELLKRNPSDLSVQVAAVSAALAAGDTDRAAALARKLTADYPDEPQGWLAAGEVARARGENGAALSDLRRARDLRLKQLRSADTSDAQDVMAPGWIPGQRYALNDPPNILTDASPQPPPEPVTREYERYAQNAAPYNPPPSTTYLPPPDITQPLQPLQPLDAPPAGMAQMTAPTGAYAPQQAPANQEPLGILSTLQPATPVRNGPAPTPDEPNPGGISSGSGLSNRAVQPTDALTQEIDRSIQQVSADVAPQADATLSFRGRSGSQGLGALFDVEAPLEASFSPNGYGRLKVQVTPVYLSSGGSPSFTNRALFGTNPLTVARAQSTLPASTGFIPNLPGPASTTAAGAGLDVSYAYDFVTADIGTTPLGFNQQSVVGGIQFLPRFSNNLALRLTADRRAVTDSVLSYAGLKDGATGESWGGVTRNRLYAQLEGSVGKTYYYVGGGASAFVGEQVAFNWDREAGAGVSTPVWSDATKEVRLGANAVYFGFTRNLGNFTLGNGGYFSPQQYFAFLVPTTFRHQVTDDLVYSVQGTIGVQTFRAKSAPVFPSEDQLQTELVQLYRSGNSSEFPYVSGFRGTGLAGGVRGDVDYRVNPNLHVGASAGFDRSGNFTEGTGLVYARYTFDNTPATAASQ